MPLATALLLFFSIVSYSWADNSAPAPFFFNHPKFSRADALDRVPDKKPKPFVFLYNTPSSRSTKAIKHFQSDSVSYVQVIAINEPCLRNARCGSYEFLYGLSVPRYIKLIHHKDSRFKAKAKKYASRIRNGVLSKIPEGKPCAVTPLLETILSRRDAETFYSWVAPIYSRCDLVWNPVGNNPGAPIKYASISEGHGEKIHFNPKYRCIANNDGTPIPKQRMRDFLHRHKECEAVFLWSLGDNCNPSLSSKFIDPRKRTCEWRQDWNDIKKALSAR